MRTVRLRSINDFAEWRGIARDLLREGVRPEDIAWLDPSSPAPLFDEPAEPVATVDHPVGTVPPKFIELAETAICHTDPERFGLLYRLLFRLQKDKSLLDVRSDTDIGKLERRVSAVRRDAHKMAAFVRFRSIPVDGPRERYAAWFEPEHYIVERTAPFFVRRFSAMDWAIVTPYRTALWDGETLNFSEGGKKGDVPAEDAMEDAWLTYFSSIFNPARLKISAMKGEMPVKYWRNLPEAELIPSLIRGAREAEQAMLDKQSTIPPSRHLKQMERQEAERIGEPAEILSLADARSAIEGCRRCPLYEYATQAVFGEGPETADIMFVGEQPGDQEDLAGKPFIGPAGQVFDKAVEQAGIDRTAVYVTNSVKHFKFEPRGKRRIHKKPDRSEVQACKFWLNLERAFVKPKLVVALGATAAGSLLNRTVTISGTRGEPIALEDGSWLLVTVHPSYLLRITDRQQAEIERERFVDDLVRVRDFAATLLAGGVEGVGRVAS